MRRRCRSASIQHKRAAPMRKRYKSVKHQTQNLSNKRRLRGALNSFRSGRSVVHCCDTTSSRANSPGEFSRDWAGGRGGGVNGNEGVFGKKG